MPEHAAARFVQHEVPQGLVLGDEGALRPERLARRRGDAADDDVADFAFRMGGDDMDRFAAAHQL